MIALLDTADLPALVAHMARHCNESGTDGDLIFRPRSGAPIDEPATIARHRAGWNQPLDATCWLRTWGVVIDGEIRGHVELHGGQLVADAHRAMLGMGIERSWRGQGHGRALLQAAIAWANQARLAWLDLGVFAHNERARALYRSAGFVEVGRTPDRFRVDGVTIDDIAMVRAL